MSEQQSQTHEVAKSILKEEKSQNRKEGIQTAAMVLIAVCIVIITFTVISVMNNVNNKINAIYAKADTAITTIDSIATEIQEADLKGMAEQIRDLTTNATEGVNSAMEKIDSINIDELNESISQLDAATEALRVTLEGISSIFGH